MTDSFLTLGALREWRSAGSALILDYGGPRVAITILTDRIIRVRLAPDGTFAARRSWAVAREDDAFPEASFEIEEPGQALVLRTASLMLRIERDRGSLFSIRADRSRLILSSLSVGSDGSRSTISMPGSCSSGCSRRECSKLLMYVFWDILKRLLLFI